MLQKTDLTVSAGQNQWKFFINLGTMTNYVCPIMLKHMTCQAIDAEKMEQLNKIVTKRGMDYRFVLNSTGYLRMFKANPKKAMFENYLPRTKTIKGQDLSAVRPRVTRKQTSKENVNNRESQMFWRDSVIS